MSKITRGHHQNAFVIGPTIKLFQIHILAGGAGIFGMNMEIGDEFHN